MQYVLDLLVYVVLGAVLSWFFYYLKRLDIFGGFLGGALVAVIGAILGAFLLQVPLKFLIDALQNGFYISNVNVIAALIGGVASLWLLSKINNGRKRKDY
ncbi:MAG TPA: hypothetical protein PLY93_02710 [Turneriella sp.]|nr:hypothetical protein [Turneriella sp.]